MYYTLYIDELFLENLLLDYFLLTVIGRVLKLPVGRLRRLLGAALGSLGLCLLYVFSLERTWIGAVLLYGAIAGLMVGVGLHPGSRGLFGKAAVLLYLCSFLLGGIFRWLDRFFGSGVSVFILFPYKLLDSVCGDELADAASEEGNQDREGDAVFPWKKHLS